MQQYDLVIVGTGFASSFFLKRVLEQVSDDFRILVLEIGQVNSHRWQVENKRQSNLENQNYFESVSKLDKEWVFNLGFGGSSNCWSACTPRMLENDFNIRSMYGVGTDWPLDYKDIEKYYCYVESIMGVSGPDDWSLSPRSESFPQPPHKFSDTDLLLKKAYPNYYYQQATARPSISMPGRPACCASSTCELCPIDSKFSVLNSFKEIYEDKRLKLVTGAEVEKLNYKGGVVVSAHYSQGGNSLFVGGDVFVLGANAIFNASILIKSNYQHPDLGCFLHEQVSKSYLLDIKEVEGFNGGTLISGQGYMFYDGEHRSKYGACVMENFNTPIFRVDDHESWLKRMVVKFIVEDIPLRENKVKVVAGKTIAEFLSYSNYGLRGLKKIDEYILQLSDVLNIEAVHDLGVNATEAHIQGTVRMGVGLDTSVVDSNQLMHELSNLYVVGSSSFPSGAPVNPTLTLSALSVKSADHFLGSLADDKKKFS
jgi:choline dehydrogenase-like flavoprotein